MAKTPNRAQPGAQDDTIQSSGGKIGPAHEAGTSSAQEGVTIGGDDDGEIQRHCDDRRAPHIDVHILLPNDRKRIVHPGSLIITCQEPGFRRAGIAHPAFAVHGADRFSPNQIAQLRNESKLTVIEIG